LSINPINPGGRILSDIRRFDVPFPVLIGRGSRIIRDYQVRALPSIYIIDKTGKIAEGGKFIPFDKMEALIKSLAGLDKAEVK